MSGTPSVAVVVGEFAPRGFVRSALRSLAAQTLAPDRFEVVVTASRPEPELLEEAAAHGWTVRRDGEPRIGRWLRRAVDATRAPIVTFLDDDDEFEPERLATIAELFARDREIGFYRNRVRVIDAAGRAIPPELWRPLERDRGFDRLGRFRVGLEAKPGIVGLAHERTYVTFNSSSMAIRRELLDDALGAGFERTQLPDQYLFLAALLAPYALFLDDRRLTRFRLSPASVTRRTSWLAHAESSYCDMARLARERARPDLAAWLSARSVHYGRLFRGGTLVERVAATAGRREVAERTREYLRYLGRYPAERLATLDAWAPGIYGLAYLGAPGAAARFARARLTARGAS